MICDLYYFEILLNFEWQLFSTKIFLSEMKSSVKPDKRVWPCHITCLVAPHIRALAPALTLATPVSLDRPMCVSSTILIQPAPGKYSPLSQSFIRRLSY